MSIKPSVLIFTDWFEPGYKAGGPIRSCRNIVSTLSGSIDFYIVTSDRDLGDSHAYPSITTDRWTLTANGQNVYYASPGSLTVSKIASIISDLKPSTVYLNSLFSPRFTIRPLWVLNKIRFNGRIVLAPRGMLRKSALAQKPWKKKIFLWLSSFAGIRRKVVFHATDQQERSEILDKFGKTTQVVVAENIPLPSPTAVSRRKEPGKLRIVFLSRIHPVKNLLFAIDVLDRANLRNIEFDIYGATDDTAYYTRCFQAAKKLEGRVNVHFMGEIPHDEVNKLLHEYHLLFVPTLGENFGHAIFEALSCGCPVLISDQTPWMDVEKAGAGWAIPLAEKVKFVNVIGEMYRMEDGEFSNLSSRAAAYARKHYSSIDYVDKYLQLFGAGVKLK